MSSFGVGGSARPQAAPYPLRTPRSPTGHTSSRPSWKMRNISAVQRPMPGTVERRAISSSPRSASTGTASTPSGVSATASSPPVATATNRPKIVAAARPASCWNVMLRQRAPKCERPRRRSRSGGPTAATSVAITGSRPASSLVAAARTASKSGEAKSVATGSEDLRRRGTAAPYRFRRPVEPLGEHRRAARRDEARAAAEAALTGDLPDEAALRRVVEILAGAHPAWGWVGVYVLAGDTLVLGPYVGPPTEHTRISVGVGVCGTAVARDTNVVV